MEMPSVLSVHVGSQQCYQILKENFTWGKMYKSIKQILKTCKICQKCKHSNKTLHADMKPIIATAPRKLISVDLIGPFPRARGGMRHLFVMIDVFTKFIQVYPIKRPTARAVCNIVVNKYIEKYGNICRILSDHGTQFTSRKWKRLWNRITSKLPTHQFVIHRVIQ